MTTSFINSIYRMRFIDRWATSRVVIRDNVAEHSYYVTIIALILDELYSSFNSVETRTAEIVTAALFHDLSDSYTAHIISPIKKYNQKIESNLNEFKNEVEINLFSNIPFEASNLNGKYFNSIEDPYVRRIIDWADSIDAFILCSLEKKFGNADFHEKEKVMAKKVCKLAEYSQEVEFFLKNFIDFSDFELKY